MKFISSTAHGIFDYIMGIGLILLGIMAMPEEAPAIAGIVLIAVGALVIILALFTNYEMGLVRKIKLANHQMADNAIGVFLAVSPWLFNHYEITYGFHMLIGFAIIFFGMFTRTLTHTMQHESNNPGELHRIYLSET